MWIIGVMNKNQMAILQKGGYDVKVVDELKFNKLLDPKHDFAESCREIGEDDVLAATFTEADMFDELKMCIREKFDSFDSSDSAIGDRDSL